jgi:hypothetical protein
VAQDAPPLSHVKHVSHVNHLWHIEQMDVHLSIKAKLVLTASAAQELKSAVYSASSRLDGVVEFRFTIRHFIPKVYGALC